MFRHKNTSQRFVLAACGGLLSVACVNGTALAALISTPGLTSIVFWEFSGPAALKSVSGTGAQITTQLAALNGSSNDFTGVPNEWYDVFYSNANGTFNPNGNYVTVEARYDNASGGGGLNIGAVDMFIGATPMRANVLTSWVGIGGNYVAGSELLSVDPADVAIVPTTFTTMGNTAGVPGRLRITVTWSKLVPEPSSCLLAVGGIAGMLGMSRQRRQK